MNGDWAALAVWRYVTRGRYQQHRGAAGAAARTAQWNRHREVLDGWRRCG